LLVFDNALYTAFPKVEQIKNAVVKGHSVLTKAKKNAG